MNILTKNLKKYFILLICNFSFYILAYSQNDTTTLFVKKTYIFNNQTLPYRFHFPDTLKKTEVYPLIIFLHGAGERGKDNQKQLIHGVMRFVEDSIRQKYPCFILVPQCPEKKRWVEVDWTLSAHTQPKELSVSLKKVMQITNKEILQNPIDTQRIYVAGLSMGGFGTWDLISRYPDKFAAAIPVCGGGDTIAAKNIKCAVWDFHGAKDNVVMVKRSRDMVEAIEKNNKTEIKYTEYPNIKHGSWWKAFKEPELIQWLFSHKRNYNVIK